MPIENKSHVEAKPAAQSFSPYVPGLSTTEIKERYGLGTVIKLASNENPLGASPIVQKVLQDNIGLIFRYPQSGVPKLHEAIAAHHNLPASMVAVGNGSDEIIDLLIRVLAEAGKHNIVAFNPCFSIYKLQAKLTEIEFRQVNLNADFSFPWREYLAQIDENTRIAFITTPDNPSGYAPLVGELKELARAIPSSCLLVIDEAYMDFCPDEKKHSLLSQLQEYSNVCILRTFSKSFGLAGLRVGYGLMPPHLADVLRRVHLPFSVNLLAEAAALAALEDKIFYKKTLETVCEERPKLAAALEGIGFTVLPSMANFLMVKPPLAPKEPLTSAPISAVELFEALLARGIILRPLASYGLNDYLRITIGTPEENAALLLACKEVLARA